MTAYTGKYVRRSMGLRERLDFHSEPHPSGCRIWTGSTDGKYGYGKLKWDGRMQYAHVLAWTDANERPVPAGMEIMHSCDRYACIEPAHLSPGTHKANIADQIAKGRHRRMRGETHTLSRITAAQAAEIRARSANGESRASLARAYRVSANTVWRIATGQTYHGRAHHMQTYGALLSQHGISIPEHLEAEAQVPVLSGVQAQGDLLVVPVDKTQLGTGQLVPMGGYQVVRGEAAAHTHWLDGLGPVSYAPNTGELDGLVLGELTVPDGSVAYLTHEDEHGSNGIGAGRYEIRQKRELADEIRYVED